MTNLVFDGIVTWFVISIVAIRLSTQTENHSSISDHTTQKMSTVANTISSNLQSSTVSNSPETVAMTQKGTTNSVNNLATSVNRIISSVSEKNSMSTVVASTAAGHISSSGLMTSEADISTMTRTQGESSKQKSLVTIQSTGEASSEPTISISSRISSGQTKAVTSTQDTSDEQDLHALHSSTVLTFVTTKSPTASVLTSAITKSDTDTALTSAITKGDTDTALTSAITKSDTDTALTSAITKSDTDTALTSATTKSDTDTALTSATTKSDTDTAPTAQTNPGISTSASLLSYPSEATAQTSDHDGSADISGGTVASSTNLSSSITISPDVSTGTSPVTIEANKSVTSISPTQGPFAGGTQLQIVGHFKGAKVKGLLLGDSGLTCEVEKSTQAKTSNGEDLAFATVPAANSEDLIDQHLELRVQFDDEEEIILTDADQKFIYRKNPKISNIYPTELSEEGGDVVYVKGQHLDVVENPKLRITIMKRISGLQMTKEHEVAHSGKSNESLQFTIPPLEIDSDEGWRGSSRRKRDSSAVESIVSKATIARIKRETQGARLPEITWTIGFVFDGYDGYADISSVTESGIVLTLNLTLPQIHIKSWSNIVMKYDPNRENKTIEILGTNLLRRATIDAYQVDIGQGDCVVLDDTVTDEMLECTPPEKQPEGADSEGKLPVIVRIKGIGNHTVGYIRYPNESNLVVLVPAVAAGGVAFIVALITLIICCLRARDVKEKKQPKKKQPVKKPKVKQTPNPKTGHIYDRGLARAESDRASFETSPPSRSELERLERGRYRGGHSVRSRGDRLRNWVSNSYFRMSEYFRNRSVRDRTVVRSSLPRHGDRFGDRRSFYSDTSVYDYRAGDPYGPTSDPYYSDEGYHGSRGAILDRGDRSSWMPTDDEMDQMLADPNFVIDDRIPEDIRERLRERRSYKLQHKGPYAKPAKKLQAGYKQNSFTKRHSGGRFMTSEEGLSEISQDVASRRNFKERDDYHLYKTMQKDQRHRPATVISAYSGYSEDTRC